MTIPVLLQTRVDALTIGYKLHISGAVNDEIAERQAVSDLARAAEFRAGGFRFLMRRNRSIERFYFGNHDCRCCFDRTAPAGWNFEVIVGAPFLATHPLSGALALSKSVAEAMGEIEASHLRRVDPMGDYMHFGLRRLDASRFVTTRAKRKGFLVHAKDLEGVHLDSNFHEYLDAGGRVTGVTIAAGNPFSFRGYNKGIELTLPGREEKRDIEKSIWERSGYTGVEDVMRAEFQIRGEALESFGLRNPEDLESSLDGLWQYGVRRWTRLVKPTRKRRRECPLDPRWEPVVATVFRHPAEPAKRSRVRGGATAQQALGTSLSRLGSIGRLPKIAEGDEAAFVKFLGPERATTWLMQSLSKIFEAQARDCFEQLVLRHGPEQAALWFFNGLMPFEPGIGRLTTSTKNYSVQPMRTESFVGNGALSKTLDSTSPPGDSPLPPSAVERLIAARIAEARRGAAAELASARAVLHGASSRAIPPPTAAERATLTFVAWMRSREPDFFASAPTISGECKFLARLVYEQRLQAYGRAWSSKPAAGQAQQGVMFK